jgi:hypothetical protein
MWWILLKGTLIPLPRVTAQINLQVTNLYRIKEMEANLQQSDQLETKLLRIKKQIKALKAYPDPLYSLTKPLLFDLWVHIACYFGPLFSFRFAFYLS